MRNKDQVKTAKELVIGIKDRVAQSIIGKENDIQLAIVALLCRGHILIEDVPGTGKTAMAKALAQSLGCTFKRIQFTPDLMPSDVLGVNFYNQKLSEFEFMSGPIFGQMLLADEINRATPRTQSALLEAMQENQVSVDGETMPLSSPFMVLATQNPVEMEGTFPLPEAQLDRFKMRIQLGYPTAIEESNILLKFHDEFDPITLDPVTYPEEIIKIQREITGIKVDNIIRQYIVNIAQASRDNQSLQLGASPRASIALYRGAQAVAAIEGRDFVLPDDVKQLVPYVIPHRLVLTSNARLRGRKDDEIAQEILSYVDVPIER